jgi:hypothetical protein
MTSNIIRLISRMALPAILFGCGVSAKADIFLSTATPSVTVGSSFEVDIIASNINLGGYQLNLGFDPLLVTLDSIVFDGFLGSPLSFTSSQQGIDSLEIDEVSFADEATLLALQGDAAAGNQFLVARLTFTATQAGTAAFAFNSAVLTDQAANALDADLRGISISISSETPTPAPEPAAWALLGACLGVVGLVKRRR